MYRVIYIHPTKDEIANDKFCYERQARSYMKWLKAHNYRDVHMIKSDIGE
jgi:hypothetical protein